MKNKILFWTSIVMWGVLALLMTASGYSFLKETTTLSYFWCGIIAFGCGVGVIFFPLTAMVNIFFVTEG